MLDVLTNHSFQLGHVAELAPREPPLCEVRYLTPARRHAVEREQPRGGVCLEIPPENALCRCIEKQRPRLALVRCLVVSRSTRHAVGWQSADSDDQTSGCANVQVSWSMVLGRVCPSDLNQIMYRERGGELLRQSLHGVVLRHGEDRAGTGGVRQWSRSGAGVDELPPVPQRRASPFVVGVSLLVQFETNLAFPIIRD
jgi:hypothetical protein